MTPLLPPGQSAGPHLGTPTPILLRHCLRPQHRIRGHRRVRFASVTYCHPVAISRSRFAGTCRRPFVKSYHQVLRASAKTSAHFTPCHHRLLLGTEYCAQVAARLGSEVPHTRPQLRKRKFETSAGAQQGYITQRHISVAHSDNGIEWKQTWHHHISAGGYQTRRRRQAQYPPELRQAQSLRHHFRIESSSSRMRTCLHTHLPDCGKSHSALRRFIWKYTSKQSRRRTASHDCIAGKVRRYLRRLLRAVRLQHRVPPAPFHLT